MRVHCTNCGRDGHAKWQCTRPTKSTAARKDVQVIEVGQRPTKVGESQNIAVSPKDRDMADHTAKTEKTGSRCRTLPVDTDNPSSPKGSGVESLRIPTEGRKGRDSTSGGARAKLRDPSAVLTQTAAKPPVGTNSVPHANGMRDGIDKLTDPRKQLADASSDQGSQGFESPVGQKFNKVAYMAKYMARYRSEIKSGKRTPKPRA